jgi:hypothetical protein
LGFDPEITMRRTSIERVGEDLAVMRRAMGFGFPFEWEHVWACLALALVGATVAAITLGTGISARPAVSGSTGHLAYVSLLVAPVFLVLGVMAGMARRRRAASPLFWREQRHAWTVALVIVPLYVGFVVLAVRSGLAAGTLTSTTLFLAGLFGLSAAIFDSSQRYTLGFAVSTLLAGALAPWARYERAGLLVGGWLVVGGVSTAILMARQLRNGAAHVAD